MIPFFKIRGYDDYDPLDNLNGKAYWLHIAVTAVISLAALFVIINLLNIATFRYSWLFWAEIAVMSFIYAPVVVFLRKSSSLVLMLLLMATAVPLDLYIESNYRFFGEPALWIYNSDSILGSLQPLLRIAIVWIVDSLIFGPLCLWASRLIAGMLTKRPENFRTKEQYHSFFKKEWSYEEVAKPKNDFSFWFLRILGLIYVVYLGLLVVSIFGINPYPEVVKDFIQMTYANPTLTVNTYIKVVMMTLLCFIGAYNKELRFHSALALAVAHLMSTLGGLFFYFYNSPDTPYRQYLIASAIVDGVLVIALVIIMLKYKTQSKRYSKIKEFPEFYSLPNRLTTTFYLVFGIVISLIIPAILFIRFFVNPESGWGAIYGFPDPQLTNTITKYTTIAFIAFLIGRREKLRDHLYKPLLLGYSTSVVVSLIWLLVGGMLSDVTIATRSGGTVTADWYFMLNVGMDGGVVLMILAFRKMYFNVEYSISAMSPANAQNVLALHEALLSSGEDDGTDALISIDQHVAGIRGRKRGLLNFPFWLVENNLPLIYGLHPSFSAMDTEQRKYFLRKFILRPPDERLKSAVPMLAELFYRLGTAVHALVTLAHYNQPINKEKIGFVPPEARDRLEGDYASAPPPFQSILPIPDSPAHPGNNKKNIGSGLPLVAARVVTGTKTGVLPDEADYIVIGSGAGGAVAAYRLACEVNDPSKILLVERGPKYSPLQDFNDNEMEMVRKLYKEGGLQQTKRFDLTILQGECLGGTTVVNNAICLQMPDFIKNNWESEYDINLSQIENEYQKVAAEIEIKPIPENAINQKVKEKFIKGVDGYNSTLTDQEKLQKITLLSNHRDPLGEGLDNIGNKRMRKRSMLETYIPWSEGRGVKVVSNMSAVRFMHDGSKATGVMFRTNTGTMKTVKVKKGIIIACGVIASSHLLMRSGLTKNVGKGLSCNFAFPAAFQFPHALDAFDGLQITLGALDQKNRAVFETFFNPPASFSITLPFYFNRSAAGMKNYRNTVNFGSLVGSEPNGEIELKANLIDGRSFNWKLGFSDKQNIKFALSTLAEIGLASGAEKVMLPFEPGIELPLTKENVKSFREKLTNYPLDMADLRLTTAHPQGGNRMIGDKSRHKDKRVVSSDYKVDGLDNVFVADASLFPTGITINPQWTIMAMSSMSAKKALELC